MIRVRCQCSHKLKLPTEMVGKLAKCSQCDRHLRIVAAGYAEHTDDPAPDGVFVVERGPQCVGEQLFLAGSKPIGVGKGSQNVLRLRDASVSTEHCVLVLTDYGWRIEDRDSTNGVHVNGRRVRGHNLLDGDEVDLGKYHLRYFSDPCKKRAGTKPTRTVSVRREHPQDDPREAAAATATPVSESEIELLETFATMEESGTVALPPMASPILGKEEFRLAEEPADTGPPVSLPVSPEGAGDGPVCPSCKRTLPARSKICTQCGVDLRTGRSLITAQDTGLDERYETAERVIRFISWLDWFGIYPIASEAYGAFKPYAVRTIAVLTVLISSWFLYVELFGNPAASAKYKNLMLWSGAGELDAETIDGWYHWTNQGDTAAYQAACRRIEEEQETRLTADQTAEKLTDDEVVLAAHASLDPEDRCTGEFRLSQLITHAFLHGGLIHLAGNLLFLMIFGSRVNALIGNVATAILYPLLAVGAGVAHMASVVAEHPHPMLGASGAVMGLAGMYFVFFPVHKMHMAAWMRLGLLFRFRLSLKIFSVRGFWVVLFYIGFDVVLTSLGAEDGVAHWAHLGGFIVGAVLALLLLMARLVNARGGDLLSVIFGRYAWALIGRPDRSRYDEEEEEEYDEEEVLA